MACAGCSNGRGCNTMESKTDGSCNNCSSGSCNKLNVFNWLGNITEILPNGVFSIVEVRFKNSRKEHFINSNKLSLYVGDIVVTESETGYDIGTVSATGEIVKLQLKKKNITDTQSLKKILRKAKQPEIQKWQEAQKLEYPTMHKAREIALSLKLEMKIIDVEYQGDKVKATFYYTADGRVDFRELIKKLAETFRVRIEMRQIGARQEAARLGGIGVCGRELCCSTWLNDFRSVNTSAMRYQQLSINPTKLAGQCGKLKCCLNYELDTYVDALKEFPDVNNKLLKTKKGQAKFIKHDLFKKKMWWAYEHEFGNFIAVSIQRVNEILEMNANNILPEDLNIAPVAEATNTNPIKQNNQEESLNRFDDKFKKNKNHFHRHKKNIRKK